MPSIHLPLTREARVMVQSKARMPEMNAQRLCMDAKPTKRSFKGKGDSDFRAIVRFWEGWVRNEGLLTEVSEKRKGYGKCGNPSGSRPNFFGDSTSPLTRGGKNVVRSKGNVAIPPVVARIFFGRQHLPFDKGGKCDGVGQGLVRRFIC